MVPIATVVPDPAAGPPVASDTGSDLADVGVAIVSYHCRDDVVACVESVRASAAGSAVEIVVADNGSSDGTVEALRDLSATSEVLDLGRNTGFAHATNRAIAATRSRHVLLLNPDTVAEPGAISAMVAWLDEHPTAGVVAPRLVNPDGSDQQTARAFPTPAAAIFGRRSPLTRLFPRNRWSSRFLAGRDHDGSEPFEIDWVSGAALMVPRAVIDEVGGLDEGFFLYWEDADWCRRIKDAGYGVWCVPEAVVVHHEGGTRDHGWPTPVVVHFHAGAYRYWRIHHAPQAWNPLRWGAAAALAARAVVVVLREQLRAASSDRWGRGSPTALIAPGVRTSGSSASVPSKAAVPPNPSDPSDQNR